MMKPDRRLYRRMAAWDRLVEVLHKKSHTVDDGELAVKLRLQVGELWEERLDARNVRSPERARGLREAKREVSRRSAEAYAQDQ